MKQLQELKRRRTQTINKSKDNVQTKEVNGTL
jgi:hypothetical protein